MNSDDFNKGNRQDGFNNNQLNNNFDNNNSNFNYQNNGSYQNNMNNMNMQNMNMQNSYNNNFALNDYQINETRHRKEKVLYIVSVVINIVFIISVLTVFCTNFNKCKKVLKNYSYDYSSETLVTENEAIEYRDKSYNKDDFYRRVTEYAIVTILIAPLILLVVAYLFAQVRSRSIKITPRQFPEVYELIVKYCNKLGLKEIPDAYVVQENGVLNAFSSFVLRKKYIQINADLFEIAYREYNDLDSIGFVIAHELTHIKLKHAYYGYQLSIYSANYVPFLGTALSRAREYSCDRIAQVISESNGVDAIMSLYAGKHLYKKVNVQDYLDNIYNIKGFFVWIYNAFSSHPILPKRLVGLINRNVHGKLF